MHNYVSFIRNFFYMGKTELYLTIVLFNLFFVVFMIAVIIYIRRYKTKKAEYENELRITNEIHQKELLATQLEIQKETMQQIGRELHDNIGQKMTMVSIYSQQFLHENKYPELETQFRQISDVVKESIQDLRSLSRTLTNDKISENSIIQLIEEEVNNANSVNKCQVKFQHRGEDPELNVMQKNVLLRITQEFIQNSMKHSGCLNITIDLENNNRELLLQIRDDGKGFNRNAIQSDGIGLTNMENRAKIIGADFLLETAPNAGTAIFMKLEH